MAEPSVTRTKRVTTRGRSHRGNAAAPASMTARTSTARAAGSWDFRNAASTNRTVNTWPAVTTPPTTSRIGWRIRVAGGPTADAARLSVASVARIPAIPKGSSSSATLSSSRTRCRARSSTGKPCRATSASAARWPAAPYR